MYNTEKIKKDLKNNMSQSRYDHSLLVAQEAKLLARHYHIDEEKAYVAGLVHDIAKEFSEDDNKRWIEKYHLSQEWLLPENKKIIHAEVGSYVVKEWYAFDEAICNAVKYHTIGDPSMQLLAKIVFIADKIGRKNITPVIQTQKSLAYKNLDKALEFHMINLQNKLEQEGKNMHPNSLKLIKILSKRS